MKLLPNISTLYKHHTIHSEPNPPSDEDMRHVSEGLGGGLQLKVEFPPQSIEPHLHRDPDTRLLLPEATHISLGPLLVLELRIKY